MAPLADAVITLSCQGPAPLWSGDEPGKPLAPRPTGDPVFNFPSSMLFAPAVTVPLMGVGGMPVGVQLMGRQHEDIRITAMAPRDPTTCRCQLGPIRGPAPLMLERGGKLVSPRADVELVARPTA